MHYLSVPPSAALPAVQLLAEAGLVERCRIIMEKPFGTDLASAVVAERASCTKSSTRSRSSASTISSARSRRRTSWPSASPTACSSRSGTATSSTTCRSTCRRRWASASAPAFYETDRRLPRHGGDAPVPDPRPSWRWSRRPRSSRRRSARRRTRSSARMLPIEPRDVVRGQYIGYRERGGRRPRIRHRDLHRAQVRHRQLALGRRAVLPAHRQAPGRGPAHHLDRLPRAAQEHVPGRLRRRRAGPGPPDLRPRRRLEDVAVLLRQAARARACGSTSSACSSPCTTPA